MSTLARDTHPEAERVQFELLRDMPPWRRLELVGELNRTVRLLALRGLEQRYPTATPSELRRLLADLLLGPELAGTVYGPLPALAEPGHAS